MPDARLMCKDCATITDHMQFSGRNCICSVCGRTNLASAAEAKQIKIDIEARKKQSVEALARVNGMIPQEETVKDACPKNTHPTYKLKTEETAMKKLTEENIAEIKRRKAAGEKVPALAAEYKVNRCSIYALLKGGYAKKEKKVSTPKKTGGSVVAENIAKSINLFVEARLDEQRKQITLKLEAALEEAGAKMKEILVKAIWR